MRLSLLAFFVLTIALCNGQNYDPTAVILSPYETIYDSALLTEIETYYLVGYTTPEDQKQLRARLKDKPENIATMEFAEWRFKETKDFASMLTLSYYTMISYQLFGVTDKLLVFPSHNRSSGKTSELRLIANRHKVRWIINPVSIHSYLQGGKKITTIKLQIFDGQKGKVILTKDYTGDSKNPGLEFSCTEGSLSCTINNILIQSLNDILLSIVKN